MTIQKHSGSLRIIGGKWRSRKISFLGTADIRPTTDSVRETLFNWLAPHITDSTCLDLFAGSGALGFEALSRGANYCCFTDCSAKTVSKLKEIAALLLGVDAKSAEFTQHLEISKLKIPSELAHLKILASDRKFDIVFIDPPYRKNLLAPTCAALEELGMLANDALIYLESERDLDVTTVIPKNWEIIRSKIAGQVGYHLARRIQTHA